MNEEMNFCSQCGEKINSGVKFCSNCGHDLQNSSTKTSLDANIKLETANVKLETTNATLEKGTKAIPAIIILVADIIKIVFGFIFRLLKPLVIVLAVIFFVMLLIKLSSSFLA